MNFENGDAIGVFTNETQRNTLAMEKYGKKFAELSEAQKQAMSLEMIENTYKMSGALGQASREADSYENVMGNLKESWRQFTAIIGTPVLQAVIPVVKGMTNGVMALSEKVKGLSGDFSFSMDGIKSIWDTYGKPVFDRLVEVGQVIYDSWQTIMPILTVIFNNVMASLQSGWETIGKPVFDFIIQIVNDVVNLFITYFPQVADVVKQAFGIINQLWVSVLQPVLQAIITLLATYVLPHWKKTWETIKTVVDTIFNGIINLWNNSLKPILQGIIDFVSGVFTGNWKKAWEGIKNIVNGIFDGIKTIVSTVLDAVWQIVSGTVSNIYQTISQGFTDAYNKVVEIFTNIYNAIKEKIDSAVKWVQDGVKKLKKAFDFKWELPHIKLPHFSIEGEFSLKPPSVPHFGVDWYAKGGILENPTAFGINPNNGNLMVGGEAGKEAIAPISELMQYVRIAVAESNGGLLDILNSILMLLADYLPLLTKMQMVLDSGTLVGEITPQIDEELGKINERKGR